MRAKEKQTDAAEPVFVNRRARRSSARAAPAGELVESPATPSPFRKRLDQARTAAQLAYAFAQTAREFGPAMVTDATAAFLEQQMMQSLWNTLQTSVDPESGDEPRFDPKFWLDTHKAMGECLKNRTTAEALRAQLDRLAELAATEASKGAGKGLATPEIADRVREILGVRQASVTVTST